MTTTINTEAPVHGEALFLCVISLREDGTILAHGFGDTERSAIEETSRAWAYEMEDLLGTGPHEAKQFVALCIKDKTYAVHVKAN